MAKYSLVMTLTPCRVAECIISKIRPTYSGNGALTYLFAIYFVELQHLRPTFYPMTVYYKSLMKMKILPAMPRFFYLSTT